MRIPGSLLATTRPLSDPGRWLRAGTLAGLAGFAAVAEVQGWLGALGPGPAGAALLALGLTGVLLAMVGLPWRRWPAGWQAAYPFGFVPVVALLDYAAGLYYLAALPILWLALFHSRRLLLVGIGLFTLSNFLPRLLVPADYPISAIAEVVLVFGLTVVAGLAMQGMVHHTRAVAAASAANERRARADRDLLNAYLDNAGCLVVVLNNAGQVLLFNRFAERVLGYRAEDMAGRVPWRLASQAEPARDAFEQVVAGTWPVEYEDDVVTRWRTMRRISWTATGLVDETGGQVTHVISAGVDITDQRAAEQRARTDRDLLTAYLDHAGCLVVVLDPDGRVLLFNHFAEQALGYRAKDVVGQIAYQHPYGEIPSRDAFEQVLAGHWPRSREGDVLTAAGDKRRIAWNITALTDDAGRVTHVISTGVDITDQRAAERLFANVLAAAPEQMIMACDTRGVFTVFNTGAERHLGYSAEEVVGIHTMELISVPEQLAAMATEFGVTSVAEMLANPPEGEIVFSQEYPLVRKDGSRFPSMMTVATMRDGEEAVGFVAVARDITIERAAEEATLEALDRERQAAERLRQLDQVKNDFVATVSHDLRTPLTSIIGNTELLLDGDAGTLATAQHRLLDAVDRNARRLDTLVGDLLLLSRIESGTLRMRFQPVAVTDVVNGALEALAAKLTADVQVEVHAPTEPVLVQADPAQLERVATNLVSNALKFTPPGGRVSVDVTAEAGQVQLSVTDTGIGIPEDELPHVFDRFFRSSRSQQKDRPGTGLGLTIAKSIMQHHGGSITVRPNPDGGTIFTLLMPQLTATADASGTSEGNRV